MIIVTPVNLHIQTEIEIQRYLVPNFFDILPYTGGHGGRTTYWDSVWGISKHKPSNRILLATANASEQ
jgi:hypothetical protein